MMTKREATKAGRLAGEAAASWMFDGNTTDETYRAFLKGWEEGDPMAMDAYAPPSWLSGEWAGESMTEILGECYGKRDEERQDDVAQTYEEAADTAYWRTLERDAQRALR